MSGLVVWGAIEIAEIVLGLVALTVFFNLPREWQHAAAGFAIVYLLTHH